MLEVSVLELYYWAPYGKRARMTITRIGKKFWIALPIQVGIVSMLPTINLALGQARDARLGYPPSFGAKKGGKQVPNNYEARKVKSLTHSATSQVM